MTIDKEHRTFRKRRNQAALLLILGASLLYVLYNFYIIIFVKYHSLDRIQWPSRDTIHVQRQNSSGSVRDISRSLKSRYNKRNATAWNSSHHEIAPVIANRSSLSTPHESPDGIEEHGGTLSSTIQSITDDRTSSHLPRNEHGKQKIFIDSKRNRRKTRASPTSNPSISQTTSRLVSPYRKKPRVSVWYPSYPCIGSFILQPKNAADKSTFAKDWPDTTIIIRDAAIDYRKPSARYLPTARHRRLLLMVATRYNLRLTGVNSSVRFQGQSKRGQLYLDVVQPLSPMLWETKYHKSLDENYYLLHIVVLWEPGIAEKVMFLNLAAKFTHQPNKALEFSSFMKIGCVTGWRLPKVPPKRFSKVAGIRVPRTNAIAMGSRIYDARNDIAEDVAHFVARQLLGPIRFDSVSVPVPLPYSVSQMMSICGSPGMSPKTIQDINQSCVVDLHSRNRRSIEQLREDVERKLDAFGVPDAYFPRLVLLPFCRLGTLYAGLEPRNECDAATTNGQAFSMGISLLVLGPHFRWIANMDRDEFLSFSNGSVSLESASRLFDSIRVSRRHQSIFSFPWLNVYTPKRLSPQLTDAIINPRANLVKIGLLNKNCKEDQACTALYRDRTGKIVAYSDKTMWLGVHRGYVLRRGAKHAGDLESKTYPIVRSLRTFHARTTIRDRFDHFCVFYVVNSNASSTTSEPVYECDPTWEVWKHQVGTADQLLTKEEIASIQLNDTASSMDEDLDANDNDDEQVGSNANSHGGGFHSTMSSVRS